MWGSGYRLRNDAAAIIIVHLVVCILLLKVVLRKTHPHCTKNRIDVIETVTIIVVCAVLERFKLYGR